MFLREMLAQISAAFAVTKLDIFDKTLGHLQPCLWNQNRLLSQKHDIFLTLTTWVVPQASKCDFYHQIQREVFWLNLKK